MPIKIQNFLFLLGASYIVGMLSLVITSIVIYYLKTTNAGIAINNELIFSIFCSIPNVAIVLGLINLYGDKLAQYIYDKSTKHLPRLQWYCMFIAWLETFAVFLCAFDIFSIRCLVNAFVISCIIGTLFYPKKDKEKRVISAFILSLILLALNF